MGRVGKVERVRVGKARREAAIALAILLEIGEVILY